MNELIETKSEYLSVLHLQNACEAMAEFYTVAKMGASRHALKVNMQAFADVLQQAVQSLQPFQANRLQITPEYREQLMKLQDWYRREESILLTTPVTEWLMDSNKHRREFLTLLRRVTAAQTDKLLRYVLSDIIAQLQLKHDQLLDKLNRQEHLMIEES